MGDRVLLLFPPPRDWKTMATGRNDPKRSAPTFRVLPPRVKESGSDPNRSSRKIGQRPSQTRETATTTGASNLADTPPQAGTIVNPPHNRHHSKTDAAQSNVAGSASRDSSRSCKTAANREFTATRNGAKRGAESLERHVSACSRYRDPTLLARSHGNRLSNARVQGRACSSSSPPRWTC